VQLLAVDGGNRCRVRIDLFHTEQAARQKASDWLRGHGAEEVK